MRFVLLLHGEVEADSGGSPAPSTGDPGLSAWGRAQAEAAAVELAASSLRQDVVLSSPARAAREAAHIVAETLSLPLAMPRAELSEPLSSEGAIEAMTGMQERAWSLLEALRQEHEDSASLVLVTQERVIRALVSRALSMPLTDTGRFALFPGSMTTIEFRTQPRERILLAALNEVCHLEQIADSR